MNRLKNFIRNINYLTKHSLWDQREEDIVYLTDKILDDGVYEYGLKHAKYILPHILNSEESLNMVLSSGKSFVRFADGECKILMGIDQPFQKFEEEISNRLAVLLQHKRKDILVAIPRPYYYNDEWNDTNDKYHRRYSYDYRQVLDRYITCHDTYLNTGLTNFKLPGNGRDSINDAFFEKWRNAFSGRNIAIICGEGILDSFQYDIFEFASSKEYIFGPKINGWDMHDTIIQKVCDEIPRDTLIIMILGMAGKAMIPELVDLGYICWDIGHMAKLYDSYMKEIIWTEEYRANFYAPD